MQSPDLGIKHDQGGFIVRVAALIISEDRLLMAKHRDYPCYYTIGGKVHLNETTQSAAVRECLEETGHAFATDRLLWVEERFFELDAFKHHEISFYYKMRPDSAFNLVDGSRSDQGDLETVHWLPIAQLHQYEVIPRFLQAALLKKHQGIEHIISMS